jgi:hypothetical protein
MLIVSTCWSVCFPAWARSCSSVGQLWGHYHDDAHDAFMTLPPYTPMREREARQPGNGPKPCL